MIELYLLIILLVDISLSQQGCLEKSYSNKRISEKKCDEYKDILATENKVWGIILPQAVRCTLKTYDCGSVGIAGLIVGGLPAKIGEFPHMAAIGWRVGDDSIAFKCGGSLISEKFVLTAAHCSIDGDKRKPALVRLGTRNLADAGPDSAAVERNISRFIMHDDYDSISNAHDIALIELDKPVPFHKVHLRPACLQLNEYYQPNVTATGWGQLKQYSRSETSDQLMKVVLPVEKIIKCKRYLESKVLSSTRQMCAGGKDGKDTCQGDSGAPIQSADSNITCVYNIIGVTSFGGAVCGTKAPAVYTKVKYYLDWIEQTVWPGQ